MEKKEAARAKIWEIIAEMRNEMVCLSFPNDDDARRIRLLEQWLRSQEPFPNETHRGHVSVMTRKVVDLGGHVNKFRKLINELTKELHEAFDSD